MKHYLFYTAIVLLFFITAISEQSELRMLAIAGLFTMSFISVGLNHE